MPDACRHSPDEAMLLRPDMMPLRDDLRFDILLLPRLLYALLFSAAYIIYATLTDAAAYFMLRYATLMLYVERIRFCCRDDMLPLMPAILLEALTQCSICCYADDIAAVATRCLSPPRRQDF